MAHLIFLIMAGSAFASPLPFHNDDSQYRLLLEKRELIQATKWQFYYEITEQSRPENEAQYYLFLGQPRKAFLAIQKLHNSKQKTLFEAVLFALVSTSRPTTQRVNEMLTKKKEVVWNFPIDGSEIWPDEWQDIEFPNNQAREMPLVSDETNRLEFKTEAKSLFESLTLDEFLTDFNVVALAMDVEAKIPGIETILTHYSIHSENPYYKRLEKTLANAALNRIHQKTLKQENLEIELTDLKLEWNESRMHEVLPPFLLAKWGGR